MLKASVATLMTSLLLAVLGLLNSVVTARGLGVEGRGILAGALLVIALSRGVAQFGLGPAFVYLARSGRLAKKALVFLLVSVLGVSGAAAALALSFAYWTPVRNMPGLFGAAILASALGAGVDYMIISSRMQPSLSVYNLLRLMVPLMATLTIAGAWWKGLLTEQLVLLCQAGASLAVLAIGVGLMSRLLRRFATTVEFAEPRATWRQYLGLGLGYQGLGLVYMLLNYLDMVYVMAAGSLASLGIYSAAFGLSRMAQPLQMAIGNAIYARFAGNLDSAEGVTAALRAFRLSFVPLLVLAIGGVALSPLLITTLLGGEFKNAWIPFSILLIEAVISGSAFLLNQHLQAVGRVRILLIGDAISVLPLAGLMWFIPTADIAVGVALLVLLSAVTRLSVTLLNYRRCFAVQRLRLLPGKDDLADLRALLSGGKAR